MQKGCIKDLRQNSNSSNNYSSVLPPALREEPDTIQSAKKLLELAQQVNNRPSNAIMSSKSPHRHIVGEQFLRTSYERSPLKQNLKSEESNSKYNSASFATAKSPVTNYTSGAGLKRYPYKEQNYYSASAQPVKKVDTIDVKLRYSVGASSEFNRSEGFSSAIYNNDAVKVEKEPPIVVTTFDRDPIEKVKVNLQNPDERPIQPSSSVNPFTVKTSDSNFKKPEPRRIDQRPICQTLEDTSLRRSKESPKVSPKSTLKGKLARGDGSPKPAALSAQQAKYLRKRSTLKYDPLQAVKLEKDHSVNDSLSVNGVDKLKNVKARTDSNLRGNASPQTQTRADFRKGGSNSQIIKKGKVTNATVPKVTEDLSKEVSQTKYKSATKIPRLSQSNLKNTTKSKVLDYSLE